MLATSREFDINVNQERIRVEITAPDSTALPTVLSVHGAGPSNRVRMDYISDHLAQLGHSVLRFDFSGHGDSSGVLACSSLQKRLSESLAAAKLLAPSTPITLFGTSMGGHVASRLIDHLPVSNLILFCPAAYGQAAESLEFGGGFTEMIRRPNSYDDSPVWKSLEKYTGSALIISGSEDSIIPQEVIHRYLTSLRSAESLLHLRLMGAPHNIHGWLQKQPSTLLRVLRMVSGFL